MSRLLALVLAVATCNIANAQYWYQGPCQNGKCPAPVWVPAPTAQQGLPAARLVWKKDASKNLDLFLDGAKVGNLNVNTLRFEACDGQAWDLSEAIPRAVPQAMPGKAADKPCAKCGPDCKCDKCKCNDPPEAAPAPRIFQQQLPPTGVARERMTSDGQHKFTVNGKREDGETFFNALLSATGDNLTDDSGKYLLTVMGDVASCNKIRSDFVGSSLVEKCNFKTYRPTHPTVTDFKAAGSPTIVLQSPTGRVLWRQDNYEGGMNALAENAGQIFAQYDPAKDPGPGKPFPWVVQPPKPVDPPKTPDVPPAPGPSKPDPVPTPAPAPAQPLNVNTLLVLAVLAGIGFYLFRKKGGS